MVAINPTNEPTPTPVVKTEKTGNSPSSTYVVTAYALGDGFTPTHGITASGRRVKSGVTAACPKSIPFGTRVDIESVGVRTCWDRGGRITDGHIDVYVKDIRRAVVFGKRRLNVRVLQ